MTHPTSKTDDDGVSRRQLLRTATGVVAATAAASIVASPAVALDTISAGGRATAKATRIGTPAPKGGYDPTVRYVAIYGFPGARNLGLLGTLSIQQAVDRARSLAASYEGLGRPVVPMFEIIASVAAADAGGDGDYSNEFGTDRFVPYLDAAIENEMQVLFDLQTGRSTFPQQAREYEDLWLYPNAHMALDPEWRFNAPGRPGGGRIGTVDAPEVNETIDYLDDLIVRKGLPPKMLVIHQFVPSMVTNKSQIRQTENVKVVMHMDGFGPLGTKRGSYARMVADLPPGAVTGWKNFFQNDRPVPTPAQTVDDDPSPILVTYQ